MKKREKKLQAQSILATVVMGMNLVNAAAPAAALAAAEQPEPLPKQAVGEAQQEDLQAYAYEALPILAGYVDEMIFSKAEAAVYNVESGQTSNINSTGDYDEVHVKSGGICSIGTNKATVDVADGGSLNIGIHVGGFQPLTISGGNVSVTENRFGGIDVLDGNVNIGSNKTQTTVSGGTCTIDVNAQENYVYGGTSIIKAMDTSDSTQRNQVISGGVGIVNVMNATSAYNQQVQTIHGGSGVVGTMLDGWQWIKSAGAEGHIGTMSGGSQAINAGSGSIDTMYGGVQSGGKGSYVYIENMSGGTQYVSEQGSAATMTSGRQFVGWYVAGSSAVGTIQKMTDGMQIIYSGCSGIIDTMEGGLQYAGNAAYSAGSGIIKVMNGGQQQVTNDGNGTILKMAGSGAMQVIGMSGSVATGSIEIMEMGQQIIGYSGNFGTGSITLMQDGVQIIGYVGGSGIGTIATMSGGTQIINNAGTGEIASFKGGVQILNSGGTIINTVVDGGTQIITDGASINGMQVNSGMQAVTSGGTATDTTVGSGGVQYIEAGAVISGTVLDGGILRLAQSDSDYTLNNTLTINNGVLDLTDGAGLKRNLRAVPVYQKLTMSDLQGSGGSIYLDTDLANNDGDKITINNSNTGIGTYAVYVNDQSIVSDTELTGRLLLVDDQSRKLKFKGMTANNGGLWDATPILNEETNQWYLTKIVKTANNDTKVLLFDADNSYAMWRNTNDSLRSRLGALGNGSELADGVWARTQAGRFSGFGYEGRYNLYQLGYDQKADARSTYGLAVDYGDGTGDYTKGSGKDKLTAFSLYGVWQGKRGAYTNVTARAGMFDTDLKSYGDYPDKASYKEHAYSISVEYGQRFDYQQGLFFEPQAQFTLGRLSGINYTTDRGANGYIEGMNSAIGRIGFVMGQKIKNGSDIYLKADLLHEFAGKRDLQLTSDAGGTNDILSKHNDYGDTWFELGLGANIKLSKDSSFYGEVERGFGGDINKKWSINAGLRFTF
ncbi:MAG: autotransporter outer membrane beta-barrel domain-containing protein [Acidaminococcaceae bacterium]|nr:autotransporter outer membrane beta-barrel domain-containing protein [Acidaminococcaceae bacterium]